MQRMAWKARGRKKIKFKAHLEAPIVIIILEFLLRGGVLRALKVELERFCVLKSHKHFKFYFCDCLVQRFS